MVLSQKVREGHEVEYRRWQERMAALAGEFTGFEGQEVYAPGAGAVGEWVVTYRFSDTDQLTAWLDSPGRKRLLDEGRPLLDGPEAQEVLVGEPPVQEGVTVVVSHRIAPGKEDEFVNWQQKMKKVQEKYPGYMGHEFFRPVPGVEDNWVTVFRFDNRGHLDNWLASEARSKLLAEGRGAIVSYDVRRVGSAFSGWFRFGDGTQTAAWKQAMAVFLAIYPLVMVLNLTVNKALLNAGLPVFAMLYVSNVVSVVLLTWVVMPPLTRLLRFWLAPEATTTARTEVLGVLTVVLGSLAFLALFAWTLAPLH
ncbi:antibiotic biosynthesis monooxygenase [Streptomyces shenzhenensis]|uniref:antibiotic biosynthesis monooxygenase n=1 Tax=Streptomyces shenzhenensis TaxID=943815 RepID=UPI001F3E1501|nr:antibiotic biosynthesis monooxygenase [Streptomyces shenzhenensis]